MTNNDSKAYTEVLELLSHLPEEEYSKIPKEKIEFYKQNMDQNYDYKIDPEIDLSNQYISNEANAIIICLFRDYFATEKQKLTLKNILNSNQLKLDNNRRENYNPDNLFKLNNHVSEDPSVTTDLPIEIKEENFLQKIFTYIKNLFKVFKK